MTNELRSVAVRSLGSGRVHRAEVNDSDLLAATHWGAPCTVLALETVACFCGVVLKRDVIQIPEGEALESWRRNHSICKACERVEFITGAA